jgi:hypothetical protein
VPGRFSGFASSRNWEAGRATFHHQRHVKARPLKIEDTQAVESTSERGNVFLQFRQGSQLLNPIR